MKTLKLFIWNLTLIIFILPFSVFAHETEVVHEEPVPTISPALLIGIVALLAIGGFLLWKFVLHNPKSSSATQPATPDKVQPPQEKTVSQSEESEVPSQDK